MSELSHFTIGQRVELSDGRIATVQFIGSTHFAGGDWIGVGLDEATGKNDGEVQGQRYFDCPAGHGMFVRPSAVTPTEQPTPKPGTRMDGKANAPPRTSRTSSTGVGGNKRPGVLDPVGAKRQSINAASPTPTSRVSRLADEQTQAMVSPLPQASGITDAPSRKTSMSRGRSPPTAPIRPAATAASHREIEDLKTKLRLVEKKRSEDREKLKLMDKVQADRDRFEIIIQKLQSKYQPQQHELAGLKRQLKEEQGKIQVLEAQQAENDSIQEMATLDREMAEESAESMKLELDALRLKFEEMELELSVLREENAELGKEMNPEDKTSQGWLQLERSNGRLREALMRLRDVSREQEASLKDQIEELESDVQDLAKAREELAQTKESLAQSNATVEDLRQQLDTALGAEDMVEELAEKNIALNEKMEEMRMTIEDLESLKELNDELELNHTETEKQLQEEIDYHESLLAEETRKAATQDGVIQDLEYTISRFRDLVTNMQSDLEDMRVFRQITEIEANELSNRSRAMMDLNMRLQTSAAKAQVKAIDLELGKMQAQESLEHLSIIQLFLPETFRSEQDSVHALLRFRRIGFKAHMMHVFVKERITGSSTPGHEDDIFSSSDVLDKLTWVYSTCARFIHSIQTCSLESFKRLGAASYELEPVERAFNVWIEGLKRDELKAAPCANELQRSIALMSHLAEVHIKDDLEHYPDQILTRASVMQSHLENAATTLAHLKSRLEGFISLFDAKEISDDSEHHEVLTKLDTLILQSRSAKVVSGKAIRQLEDLKSRSLTLDPSTLNVVEQVQDSTSDFAFYARSFGASVLKSLAGGTQETSSGHAGISNALSSSALPLSSLFSKIQSASSYLQMFYHLTNNLSQTVEFPSPPPPPPWELLAQRMRAETADLAAREAELDRLKDEVSEKNTTMAIKDRIVEELSVKVEVLEKRVGESGGWRERVRELETAAEAAKMKEKDFISKLSHLHIEIEKLEAERETWKQASKSQLPNAQSGQLAPAVEATSAARSIRQIECLRSEISALQSCVRYLRSAQYNTLISASQTDLSTPLTSPAPQPSPLETEARDVLKEMLHLVSQPTSYPIKLHPRPKEDRLRWHPARETSMWQAQRQQEEWEEWREWRDVIAKRTLQAIKEDQRKAEIRPRCKTLAGAQLRLPGKCQGGKVQIAKPSELDEVQHALGVGAS
ncbi:MAG: hypothetical protein Q9217_000133 [Psora testacea]